MCVLLFHDKEHYICDATIVQFLNHITYYVEPCDEDEFRCPGRMYCMPNRYLCDTYNDCPDGFDEQNCSTSKTIHNMSLSTYFG